MGGGQPLGLCGLQTPGTPQPHFESFAGCLRQRACQWGGGPASVPHSAGVSGTSSLYFTVSRGRQIQGEVLRDRQRAPYFCSSSVTPRFLGVREAEQLLRSHRWGRGGSERLESTCRHTVENDRGQKNSLPEAWRSLRWGAELAITWGHR